MLQHTKIAEYWSQVWFHEFCKEYCVPTMWCQASKETAASRRMGMPWVRFYSMTMFFPLVADINLKIIQRLVGFLEVSLLSVIWLNIIICSSCTPYSFRFIGGACKGFTIFYWFDKSVIKYNLVRILELQYKFWLFLHHLPTWF